MVKSIRFGKKSPVQLSTIEAYAKKEGLDFSNAVLKIVAEHLSINKGNASLVERIEKLERFKEDVTRLIRVQGVEL